MPPLSYFADENPWRIMEDPVPSLVLGEDAKRSIVSDAFEHYERVTANDPDKMKLWGWSGAHMHAHMAAARHGLDSLIRHASGDVHISTSHRVTSVLHGITAERHIRYLADTGMDIRDLPAEVCESALVHPETLFEVDGRRLTTDFLYRLIIWRHLVQSIPGILEFSTILEIGAGLGQLARMTRLQLPDVTQIVVDLPETLIFSYSFLRATFPDLPHRYCDREEDLHKFAEAKGGILYVPAKLAAKLPPINVDMVMNTHSLGEMPIEAVQSYFEIIQSRLATRYLYSLNRYLESYRWHRVPMVAILPDRRWRTLRWRYNPQFVQTDRPYIPVDLMSTLEVILERTATPPQPPHSPHLTPPVRGEEWLRNQWEVVRLQPTQETLRGYAAYLAEVGAREFPFYRDKLRSMGGDCMDLLSAHSKSLYDLTARRKTRKRLKWLWKRLRGKA